MEDCESPSHSKWDCKYHVVFIPKCRRKTLYSELRQQLGEVFRRLAMQKESRVEEGHLMPDHVHMMISIPPKYAVSQMIGYIKGKSAIIWHVFTERGSNAVSKAAVSLSSDSGYQVGMPPGKEPVISTGRWPLLAIS
jgi:putative transposase